MADETKFSLELIPNGKGGYITSPVKIVSGENPQSFVPELIPDGKGGYLVQPVYVLNNNFVKKEDLEAKKITFNNTGTGLSATHVQNAIEEVKDIAIGARLAIVFNIKEDLDNWLLGTFARPDGLLPANLKIGENIYIIDVNVPDFWWDGTQAQILETKDSAEIINLIKPDTIEDIAAFKGVTAKTASYASSLSVNLDNITITVSGGGENSAGTLSYANSTEDYILVSQTHIYDTSNTNPNQYLIQPGNTQQDNTAVGYTRGMIYKIMIGTADAKLYESDIFVSNGGNSTGIKACAMRLRRVV
jgi:hypothetical protein